MSVKTNKSVLDRSWTDYYPWMSKLKKGQEGNGLTKQSVLPPTKPPGGIQAGMSMSVEEEFFYTF
jgi:hypothetical protein